MCAAEFAGQRLDLAARFFERPGAIDFLRGEAQLFLDGELRGNAAAGFRFAEVPREEARKLADLLRQVADAQLTTAPEDLN